MQHYNHNSYEQSHPLQSDYDPSSTGYPSQQQHNNGQYQQQEQGYQRDDHNYNQGYDFSNSNGDNQLSNLHQISPLQLDQLQAQRQYNQQQQHYNDADEALKQQHRVARTSDNKSANHHLYPPQPNGSSSSIDMQDGSSLKNSFSTLFRFPCSTNGKALLLVIGLEALLVIIIQTIIVIKYFAALRDTPIEPRIGQKQMPPYLDSGNASRAIPAYLIVFVFAQLFQLVLAWDAVRGQNTIEMIGIVAFNMCCFAYSIFEITQTRKSLSESTRYFEPEGSAELLNQSLVPLIGANVVVSGLSQCVVTWLAYQLFQEFGWKIYKKIGADPRMKRMYRAYQIYVVLIKMDFFFFVGFSIQFIYLSLTKDTDDPEYWLTIVVLPLTLPILYIAIYAVRHESRRWMTIFLFAMHGGVAYFVFKVVRMFVGNKIANYNGIKIFLTLFASLCLVTILATISNAAVCYRNFGKGLKPHLLKGTRGPQDTSSATGGRVLEID
ncbi:hypothetical protein KI688_012094 [Linnemannia hyalina]|uniref:Uncharacterized protein n=1 Tax=Linnemannia hyalina TaxID=64524 RepID=A0A9P7XUD2_9FUNG|nr:hypothetical protein KI688_012094 [Linnemannia hyalina]